MNRLSTKERAQIIGMMVEGNSIRSITRMTGVSKNTVAKLLVDVGTACDDYLDQNLKNLPCKRIQCDEIWSFVGCKEKNVPQEWKGQLGLGDVYTWTAICADTKLIAGYLVGRRTVEAGHAFIADLKDRLANRIQLSTDGLKIYLDAVDNAFGSEIDYAMLTKLYTNPTGKKAEVRYSSGECCGTIKGTVCGDPDPKHINTSYVERQNLTMRMGMRRFTRLTNAFSKKLENHCFALAIYFMHYNFGRIHSSLRVTPAMEAGISDHVWTLEEIASLA